ncbi:NADH-quinone oxidoreductase subunit L [Rheinheimera aquimaris]|jgi:NAD(P)H-quinone oxidoreductase subunit 5|uniref:Probable inorganic carbon transporter subunit DabB n=1 Tax=Rheinheimera aquimaris TaxID=412437 RepID=A0ABP3NJ86_9GAMM|nr:NADH-quinone oxidoreductase subunit L [Rheinheimera aquimaris]MCB5213057.1 NADH-quinone oxidoreductase subunit L [Rheinheimera aquimaris]
MQALLHISAVKVILLALVTLLAVVIWRYSAVALAGETDKPRFMRALAATIAAVVVTLLANHLVLFWLGWIAISLSLQQLLLFYPDRPRAQLAAHKKALSARLGEALLAVAFTLLYLQFDSANIQHIIQHLAGTTTASPLVHGAAVLLALVALLKCAQLPLHGWLIQVVEAPTPVSALLHAGIINLGGILLLLFAPLMAISGIASALLLVAALFSTVLAALIMTTRVSIKVRLAWSTVAQMGLMLVEIALGLYTLALLHLLAHSCYKAYAFLHSGNAVNHYLAAQLAEPTEPTVSHWSAAALLAAVLVGSTHLLLPFTSLASSMLLMMAVTVVLLPSVGRNDNLRWLRVMLALLYAAGLLALYLAGKTLLVKVIPDTGSLSFTADLFASAMFATLFIVAVLLRYHASKPLLNRVFIWLNAGGYLDEWATRITLKIWPYNPPAAKTIATLAKQETQA